VSSSRRPSAYQRPAMAAAACLASSAPHPLSERCRACAPTLHPRPRASSRVPPSVYLPVTLCYSRHTHHTNYTARIKPCSRASMYCLQPSAPLSMPTSYPSIQHTPSRHTQHTNYTARIQECPPASMPCLQPSAPLGMTTSYPSIQHTTSRHTQHTNYTAQIVE